MGAAVFYPLYLPITPNCVILVIKEVTADVTTAIEIANGGNATNNTLNMDTIVNGVVNSLKTFGMQ